MNDNFKEVKTLDYWVQNILPQVYDDSLSYQELLAKVVKMLNDLAENVSNIPDYVQQKILEYISSGEIGDVISDILSDFMLNVKNPPNNLTPAVGDGSQDDTLAIQGCIDYANANGGKCVYLPSGKYLTQSLTLKDNVSLVGFDRSNTSLVLKGGATKPLLSGESTNNTVARLTLDANMSIQVNDIDVVDLTGGKYTFTNLDITDGYTLMKLNLNDYVQGDTIHFGSGVIDSMLLSGEGKTVFSNIMFKELSVLKGRHIINNSVSGAMFTNIYSGCSVGIAINNLADNCVFEGLLFGATETMVNSGLNVSYNFHKRGSSLQEEINKTTYLQETEPADVTDNTVWYAINSTIDYNNGDYIFEPIN